MEGVMDDRIWTLALVWVLWQVIGIVDALIHKISETIVDRGLNFGCSLALVSIPIGIVVQIAAAWIDMVLWNLAAPTLGLPQIDLIMALIIGWLIRSLFMGITPRRVRVVDPVPT